MRKLTSEYLKKVNSDNLFVNYTKSLAKFKTISVTQNKRQSTIYKTKIASNLFI